MSLVELEHDAPAAHDSIQRGRWDDANILIREVRQQTDLAARAWSAAFTAAQALVRGEVELPDFATLNALPLDDVRVRVPISSAADHCVIGALVRFDVDAMRSWAELAQRSDPGLHDDAKTMRRSMTEIRLAFAAGDLDAALSRSRTAVASERGSAPLSIEASCVQALSALALGHDEEARRAARRACRSSRESELRAYRFLSGLVLARVRRSLGRAHLAGRILCAMRPILPLTFRGWLRWELMLSGQEALRADGQGSARLASDALEGALGAASDGDRSSLASHTRSLKECASSVAFLGPEVETLCGLLDPSASVDDAEPALRRFLSGEDPRVPLGLDALSSGREADGRPVAAVLRWPRGAPRRLLTITQPLVGDEVTVLPLTRLRKGRVDLACAVLALSANGLRDEELFRECYGFKFARHLHGSVLSMLVSRVRERLVGLYEVDRRGGVVRLVGDATILVPDPRCAADAEQKLLKLVARMGSVSTCVAARELGVSLRTVQETVSRLVEDDELTVDRSGRSVGYRLEDTSFSALTSN